MADDTAVEAPLTEAQQQLANLQKEQTALNERIASLKKTADEEREAKLNAGRELVIKTFRDDLLESLPEDWVEQLSGVEATGIQITMGPDPDNPEGDPIPLVRLTSAAAKRTTTSSGTSGNGGGSSNLRQGRKLDDVFQEVATAEEHAEHDAADNNSKKWQIKDRVAKAAGFASGS